MFLLGGDPVARHQLAIRAANARVRRLEKEEIEEEEEQIAADYLNEQEAALKKLGAWKGPLKYSLDGWRKALNRKRAARESAKSAQKS